MDFEFTNGNSLQNNPNGDTADAEEIKSLFSPCRHVHSQSLGPNYILHLSCTSETNPYIAAALSDCSCEVFSLTGDQVAKIAQLKEHADKIVDCRFSPGNNNLLYTASSDGTIKLWDFREINGAATTFMDTTREESGLVRALSSFDVSPCNRLLAAGTDLIEGDAYILFWDVRNTKLLGAYWESHTDDITQVKFHPNNSNKLMSGSTDGLINTYNLLENNEDDALQECLNTEALVEDLQWFCENTRWKISCVTSTNDLQLWDTDGAEPYKRINRNKVALESKINAESVYVAKVHPVKDSLLVLCGSNWPEGKSLRSLHISNDQIAPAFYFGENVQRVRASWLNEQTKLLFTGGEQGKLDIWMPDLGEINFKAFKRK